MEAEGSLPCLKEPLLLPILSQINLVCITPYYFPKVRFNIIFPLDIPIGDQDITMKFINYIMNQM
jgi:hypothetical protein